MALPRCSTRIRPGRSSNRRRLRRCRWRAGRGRRRRRRGAATGVPEACFGRWPIEEGPPSASTPIRRARRGGLACHRWEPPRDPQIPFLWCRLDPERAASTARSGAWVGPARATTERRVRASDRRSCESSSRGGGLRLRRKGVAEPARGVVEARSGGPRGDLEHFGDLHEGQPEVVMQDEDRPLLDREPRNARSSSSRSAKAALPSGVDGPSMGRTRTEAIHGRARWDSS